jgi:hypothetical protein
VKGEWAIVNKRLRVLRGKTNDPYDAYEWMDKLHERNNLKPLYFFHVATERKV